MFYAQFVLSKKGPLAKIWLAAHWEKKLTKAHVYETSIENSVEGILQPKVKMALRTSGHLLLGVVRIYSRKAKYLLADCNEAFVKIKMAFRPGAIDLPMTVVGGHMGDLYDPLSKDGSANYLLGTGTSSSALTTLTLPQVFHQFDTALSDLNDMDLVGSLNQAREDEITLKEDFSFVHFNGDGFGVITDFGADDFSIDPHHFQNGGDAGNHLMDETDNMYALADPLADKMGQDSSSIDDFRREVDGSAISKDMNLMEEPGTLSLDSFYDKPLRDDGFGASSSEAGLLGEGFIGDNSLFDEAPLSVASLPDVDDDMDDQPTMPQADISTTPSTLQPTTLGGVDQASVLFQSVVDGASSILDKNNMDTTPSYNLSYNNATTFNLGSAFDQREIFALEPLDVTALSSSRSADASSKLGIPTSSSASISQTIPPAKPSVKTGSGPGFHHKRKLLVDSQKGLNGDEMKRQLADSSDLVTDLNLAPPSKRLMQWKETGGCGKLIKTLRGFGRTTRSKSPDRVLFSDSQSLSKLYNQQMSSAVKAIADMINKQVLSLNMIEDEERSIFGSGFNRQPHGLTNKQNTLDVNETKDPETPSKRIKLDSIPESPFKKLDGDFDDEESHASPGGYVDEGDDDEYFGLRNSDNQSQKTPIHLDKV
ncbi:double-strand-break repair protein rad21 homolog [Gordionus sp. m RMFG-2023]|uniref:double-strand-break repair protein rad21 homolog n=1 Tax=Gordionus sp. m RMFG-2023 TaxID=3053472 RepID=UPI0031FBD2D6